MIEPNTRVIDLTMDDLMTLIVKVVRDNNMEIYQMLDSSMNGESKEKEIYVGLKGIAEALRVSYQTAQRLYSSGKLEGGYKQIGKKILVEDAQKLRDVAAHNMGKHVKKGYKRASASIIYD